MQSQYNEINAFKTNGEYKYYSQRVIHIQEYY